MAGRTRPLDPAALTSGISRMYPGITSPKSLVRAAALGFQMCVVHGVLLVWPLSMLVLDGDSVGVPGAYYCLIKGVFAALVAYTAFPGMFLGGLASHNFAAASRPKAD
jgi:hypothetical protein